MGSPTKYLWYSAKLGTNDRPWVPPGTRFTVVLQTVASGPQRDARCRAFEKALVSFWLVSHLGSLGTRARRAAGSFAASAPRMQGTFDVPPFEASGAFDPAAVGAYLRRLLPTPAGGAPDFSVLGASSHVWLAGFGERQPEDVAWYVGKALRGFRLRLGLAEGRSKNPAPAGFPDDYTVMKDAVRQQRSPRETVARAGFGLPLTFRFSSVSGSSPATLEPEGRGDDRRASPLWIRVVRLPDGTYDAVLTHLGGRFLPRGIEVRGRQGTAPAPTRSLIPHFARSMPTTQQLFPAP